MKSFVTNIIVLLLFYANFYKSLEAFSQNVEKIELSKSDYKNIEKANELKTEANTKLLEADNIYSQTASETNASEVEKLNKKAVEKQIEAMKLIFKANQIKYEVYSSQCNNFWIKYKGNPQQLQSYKLTEEKGISGYNLGVTQYNNAVSESDKLMQYMAMSGANEAITTSINDLVSAFETYTLQDLNTPYTESAQASETLQPDNSTQTTAIVPETNSTIVPMAVSPVVPDVPESSTGQLTLPPDSSGLNSYNNSSEPTRASGAVPPAFSSQTETEQPKANTMQPDEPHIDLPEPTNKPLPQYIPANVDGSLYERVKINENMIDAFNKFMQTAYPSSYEYFYVNWALLNYSDINELQAAWLKYKYGLINEDNANKDSALMAQSANDSVAYTNTYTTQTNQQGAMVAQNTDSQTNTTIEQQQTPVIGAVNSLDKPSKKQKRSKKKTNTQPQENEQAIGNTSVISNNSNLPATGFLFMVQIAANKKAISTDEMQKIYTGTETTQEVFENGWYKYTIGNYNTYSQAKDMRDNCGVNGSFIVAYLNGKRVAVIKAFHATFNYTTFDAALPVEYKIQIAASKTELPTSKLADIYSGSLAIESYVEDGWIKYTIAAGNNYYQAWNLINELNINGAFLIGFQNNNKINIQLAIPYSKKQ